MTSRGLLAIDVPLEKGVAVGNFTETAEQAAFWTEQGLRYMSFSVDMGILYEKSRDLVTTLHQSDAAAEG